MKKVYVVGIGPGGREGMTEQALAAMRGADLICGYAGYVALVTPLFPGKPALATGMAREVERCRMALLAAAEGKTVALVCGGDAGVYGMAGLVYQLSGEFPAVEIAVVPGVSAAMAGAAFLGAPLAHDFAVISLSDLLTGWEVIEKRLRAAAAADFVISLYNPGSGKRRAHLRRACDVVLEIRSPGTACGWARNVGRDGQAGGITTLAELRLLEADMFTVVFIGNSGTRAVGGKLVTPRGYGGVA